MSPKEEMRFLRQQAYHVELRYRDFRIWLVGSDDGWWLVRDLLDNSRFAKNQEFSTLSKAVEAVDTYRDYEH